MAYVALKPGVCSSADELLAHARAAIPERAAVPVRIELLATLPLTAVGKLAKPQLRLAAIEHVLREALGAEGLADVAAAARLSPELGVVVHLSGPAPCRERALALAGLYPVKPEWQGDKQ